MVAEQSATPTSSQLRKELERVEHRSTYHRTLRTTIYILLVVAAVAVLVATLWLPVLQVSGSSMEPTLDTGQIVVATKNADFAPGDVVAFYYGNKVLLKRVIGVAGDTIDIKDDGTVYVNGIALDEPYLSEKSLGQCDIDLPYQVPDGRIFVMGDNRSVSVDSRTSTVGCITADSIVGKVTFRVWPLNGFGGIS